MKLFFLLIFLSACTTQHSTSRLKKLDGAEHLHQIALDPMTNLVWNLIPMPQHNFAEAEMVCSQALSEKRKYEPYDLNLKIKWRLPTVKEFEEVSDRGLREFFSQNLYWTSDQRGNEFIGYDKVHDKFPEFKRNEQEMSVLCVGLHKYSMLR
jgi:hypothetical protein